MDTEILIGIILAAFALLAVVVLTVLARASIERIASDGYRTARQTLKEKNNGK
jgi:hypothetical protein